MSRARAVADWLTGHGLPVRGGGKPMEPVRKGDVGSKRGARVSRSDGSPMTRPSLGARRKKRRAANARAKVARRVNRGR